MKRQRLRRWVTAISLAAIGAMWIGCATPSPYGIDQIDGNLPEEDTILTEPRVNPDDEMPVEPTEPPDQLTQIQTAVETIQGDIEDLQARQQALRMDVANLGTRVEDVENNLDAMARSYSTRFDNFDAEIQRIREGMNSRSAMTPMPNVESNVNPGTPRDFEAEVAVAVDEWRQAWQQKNLNGYLAHYAPDAQVTRISLANGGTLRPHKLSRAQLSQRMTALNKMHGRMEVEVKGFRVEKDPNTANMVATFQQEFSAWTRPNDLKPVYTDKGVKTLVFKNVSNRWQIVREDWVPIQ
ncbi:MAG: hypothetical protein O3A46_08380 [Candidatus Poribacteria bacterium]|nr:hypothetical protein [Candidatus Poribacteria bacterium]